MDNPQDLITKRIQELPPYVREAIAEAQATVKLREIGARHRLRIDQQAIVEREVMLVMLGFTDEGSFVRSLMQEAHITEEGAQSLAQDVGGEIFSHIRAAMQRMQSERPQPAGASVPPTQPVKVSAQLPSTPTHEHAALMPVQTALTEERVSPAVQVNVGIAPAKPGYKADPYLEPIE